MKPQETKFEFVYNEIKQCILDGQIPHGNALPSSRMYCEQFHVSRYTINRVFEALRAEGLVDIQPRLAPIVVSKKDTCSSSNIVLEILKQKESILQVYQTFALILPSLMFFLCRDLAAKSSETACWGPPQTRCFGASCSARNFLLYLAALYVSNTGRVLAYLTMAAFNSALVLMAASVVFSCSVSLWKCSVASVAFCSNCPYSISPLLQIGKGGGHLFQIENFGPPLISRPLARL